MRRIRLIICVAVALSLLTLTAVAYAAANYAGRTSQHAPISLTVSAGAVRKIHFTIYIKCPSGHKYAIAAKGFPAIKIANGKFAEKFVALHASATATIKGKVRPRRVTGSVFLRNYENPEHHFCSATARFDLRR